MKPVGSASSPGRTPHPAVLAATTHSPRTAPARPPLREPASRRAAYAVPYPGSTAPSTARRPLYGATGSTRVVGSSGSATAVHAKAAQPSDRSPGRPVGESSRQFVLGHLGRMGANWLAPPTPVCRRPSRLGKTVRSFRVGRTGLGRRRRFAGPTPGQSHWACCRWRSRPVEPVGEPHPALRERRRELRGSRLVSGGRAPSHPTTAQPTPQPMAHRTTPEEAIHPNVAHPANQHSPALSDHPDRRKLSSIPTRSRSRISAKIWHRISSCGLRGARPDTTDEKSGAGDALTLRACSPSAPTFPIVYA